ncbi:MULTISPECIES: VOC family protein [unclassified Frankia]|uniref:VOC family protein n=1 Tax=unclassified Frankia TaxID=2632575 RepID=UPI002AD351CA|nr:MULTISPECIES: VOC family protein [unclassified Frankia]
MTTSVEPIPTDYPAITPYLHVDGAADAIDFYTRVFGATERMRMAAPDGKIGHAELTIGSSMIMLSDEYPEMDAAGPKTVGGTPVTIHVYVADVDATYDRAVKAGAKSLRPVENQFYGDRAGQFEDPFGHRWSVATHIEDVPAEELSRRAAEAMGAAAGGQG